MSRQSLLLSLPLLLIPMLPAQDAQDGGQNERDRLELANDLQEQRSQLETAPLRAEILRLKSEREMLQARLDLAITKRRAINADRHAALESEKQELEREAILAKADAERLESHLKIVQSRSQMKITRLENQIRHMEMEVKLTQYTDTPTEYLLSPLKDDGTLVISDRRIPLNETITSSTADYITDRIHYYNNANREYPIFIVIDECPGGSVMAGCRIQQAMEASDAPVHVVVKSFAASMAAAITTLAKESHAYPDAMILHHQISWNHRTNRNLTEQRDFLKNCERWWNRFGTPIAEHMGISSDEFIRRMYEHSSSGDWREFAPEAQRLKWVKHVVSAMDETSIRRHPDLTQKPGGATPAGRPSGLKETLDANGDSIMFLPRINPLDAYFLYNPDGYYRVR